MKLGFRFVALTTITLALVAGCQKSGTQPVAEHDDIAAYVAEHPDGDGGTEPEGGTE